MVKKINKNLLKQNPFNPKHKITAKELEFLKHSIAKNEFIGYPIIIRDWQEMDKYIVIDGNTRIDLHPQTEIDCYVIQKEITTENQLKELTLDYTAVSKKLNRKRLVEINNELGLAEEIYDEMFNEINVNYLDDIDAANITAEKYVKVKIFKFLSENSWETFQGLYKKLKEKMFDIPKVKAHIENMINNLDDDKLETYFFDILMHDVK